VTASARNRFKADVVDGGRRPRRLTVVSADANTIAMLDLIRVLNEVVAKGVLPTL
jgi:hypothetical protein